MLNLSSMEKELGDRWGDVRDRISEIAHEVIRRQLDRADGYVQLPNGSFVIVFAGYSGEAAEMRVASIAREIRKRLRTDDLTQDFDLSIFNETTFVSADAAAKGMETFARFVNEHRRLQLQVNSENPFVASVNARLNYVPLWEARAQVTRTALLEADARTLPPKLRRKRGCAEHAAERRAQAVIDCAVLTEAVETLRRRSIEDPITIIAPVICATSFSTDSLQNLLLPYLRSVPEEEQERFLPILRETRLGCAAADLRGRPALLRQFSCDVGLLTYLGDRGHTDARALGFNTICVDARDSAAMRSADFEAALSRFAAEARRAGLRSLLVGADQPATAAAAIYAGVDLIGGAGIAGEHMAPPPPRRISLGAIRNRAGLSD